MYTSPTWERCLSRCWQAPGEVTIAALSGFNTWQAALEKAWSCGSAPTVTSPLLGAGARGAPVEEAATIRRWWHFSHDNDDHEISWEARNSWWVACCCLFVLVSVGNCALILWEPCQAARVGAKAIATWAQAAEGLSCLLGFDLRSSLQMLFVAKLWEASMVTCHDRKFRDAHVRNSLLGESLTFVLDKGTVASKFVCGMNGYNV